MFCIVYIHIVCIGSLFDIIIVATPGIMLREENVMKINLFNVRFCIFNFISSNKLLGDRPVNNALDSIYLTRLDPSVYCVFNLANHLRKTDHVT